GHIGDIECLKAREHYNIDGVIAGQALYTGNLVTAIEIAQRPITKRSGHSAPVMVQTVQSFSYLTSLNNGNFQEAELKRRKRTNMRSA
ncbi:hypothetical protein KFU94_43465, partial [Chloroflexi bacterium TSY]|nr:hypothetical protein [Chloroflexi bacterium TSY]